MSDKVLRKFKEGARVKLNKNLYLEENLNIPYFIKDLQSLYGVILYSNLQFNVVRFEGHDDQVALVHYEHLERLGKNG